MSGVTQTEERILNGFNVERLQKRKEMGAKDPSALVADFEVKAHWEGRARSRVQETQEGASIYLGGDGELSPMDAVLGSLAACDVHLIAMHAAMIGLKIEELYIEAKGKADMGRFLGLDQAPGSGYDEITYTVHLRAPGATPEEIAYLKEKCETASPVGDTIAKTVGMKLVFKTNQV